MKYVLWSKQSIDSVAEANIFLFLFHFILLTTVGYVQVSWDNCVIWILLPGLDSRLGVVGAGIKH